MGLLTRKSAGERAMLRLKGLCKTSRVDRWLHKKITAMPGAARKAVTMGVAWWEREAKPKIPVRASVTKTQRKKGIKGPLYSKVGRGQLRKSTRAVVRREGDRMWGGLLSTAPYALWLAAGTRKIARGRVRKWKPGKPTIKSWPAKTYAQKAGILKNANAELPILLPWRNKARDKVKAILRKAM